MGEISEVIAGSGPKTTDKYNRAKTPYSSGFLFTVKPLQTGFTHKSDRENVDQALGETRNQLLKRMKESKGGTLN
jgi:hypothetical protein